MKILLIHNEAHHFAGAEKVLGYFLAGMADPAYEIAVAAAPESRVMGLVPASMKRVPISDNASFSVLHLWQQAYTLLRLRRQFPFDLVHGWTARDWELSALVGCLARRPAIGTLHDHPEAAFHTRARRRLMRWSAAWGLRQVVCVSEAVREVCARAGYPSGKLAMVHNGLPPVSVTPRPTAAGVCRFGYLGVFSEGKGLRGLFATLAELARLTPTPWELKLAGGPQDDTGEKLVGDLRQQYSQASWWQQVHWCGWVEQPQVFLSTVDLLLMPSGEFDSLPTVLLESGQAGIPAVASRVGGVEEIICDGRSGWLFESGNWVQAARILAGLAANPAAIKKAGSEAQRRIAAEFALTKMVAKYLELYSSVCRHAQ